MYRILYLEYASSNHGLLHIWNKKVLDTNIMHNVRKTWVECTHTWVWHESWDRHLKWMCDMWGWVGERWTSRQAGHQDKLQEAGQSGQSGQGEEGQSKNIDFKWSIELEAQRVSMYSINFTRCLSISLCFLSLEPLPSISNHFSSKVESNEKEIQRGWSLSYTL